MEGWEVVQTGQVIVEFVVGGGEDDGDEDEGTGFSAVAVDFSGRIAEDVERGGDGGGEG